MKTNQLDAASHFIDQANAVASLIEVRTELASISGSDFPRLSCLLELLQDQKAIADDGTLSAAFSAIHQLFCLT